jgi:hypothetical protein
MKDRDFRAKSSLARFISVHLLTICALVSCSSSNNPSGLRDVPVSEISLAEPLVVEPKLGAKIQKLLAEPSKRQELAEALAEQALVHHELDERENILPLINEAIGLLKPCDTSSHAYLETRRALMVALNQQGLHGSRILLPLLKGSWSDLDKAQIYDDLAANPGSPEERVNQGPYIVKALELRVNAAGPRSLEVAESLSTLDDVREFVPLSKALCKKLQVPPTAFLPPRVEDTGGAMYPPQTKEGQDLEMNRQAVCMKRVAQIQQDILGSDSPTLARTLEQCRDEADQLHAAQIYEKIYGMDSIAASRVYGRLVFSFKDSARAEEYQQKARLSSGLVQAQDNIFKKAYVYLESAAPKKQRKDRKDLLTKTYQAFGVDPPDLHDMETRSDGVCWKLDSEKLANPELAGIVVVTNSSIDSDLGRNLLFFDLSKSQRMYLPTFGGNYRIEQGKGPSVNVIGKNKIRFREDVPAGQDFQQIDYEWNGKTFEEIASKPAASDTGKVQTAIEDALNGAPCYGLRGHHGANHDLIAQALRKANERARQLAKSGDACGAACRLRIMFELTSDLVREASTGVPVESEADDSKDDVEKWIQAWTCKKQVCQVGLKEQEWVPILRNYALYRKETGETAKAQAVLKAIGQRT